MPKPRTASLRVAHQGNCGNATRTSLDSLDGCTCKPAYYTFYRRRDGKPAKGPRVRNRQVADRALSKLLVALDEDRAEVGPRRPRVRTTFGEWADDYLANLQTDNRRKGSTIRAYEGTLSYARPILGGLELDEIGLPEIRLVLRAMRDGGARSDATVHKHLRHMRAILTAAVEEGKTTTNALTMKFIKDLDLDRPSRVESYTDVELAKLWAQMDALGYEPAYVYVAKAAVATGARMGELVAADWDALSLSERTLAIKHHYDPIDGLTTPKNGEARTIYLIQDRDVEAIDAVGLFERWTALCGMRAGDSPLFRAPRSGGRLNEHYVRTLVDKARRKAGIAAEGEGGRRRRPFHAFRGTHSRITRERGYAPWLRQHNLGHSGQDLTDNVYGRPSEQALLEAAARQGVEQTKSDAA